MHIELRALVFEIHFAFPIFSAFVRASPKDADRILPDSVGRPRRRRPDARKACTSFSSFSFRTGTPRMRACHGEKPVSTCTRDLLSLLVRLTVRVSRTVVSRHPGSRNCFLSSYPVVLRAPSVPYAPLVEFFRHSPVRYTCCQ